MHGLQHLCDPFLQRVEAVDIPVHARHDTLVGHQILDDLQADRTGSNILFRRHGQIGVHILPQYDAATAATAVNAWHQQCHSRPAEESTTACRRLTMQV